MGWTEALPSGKYRACWRDQSGNKRSRSGFTRKAEALRYAGDQESEARRGGASYQGRSITWGDWLERWQEIRSVEASTADAEGPRITKWVLPRWGNVPLGKITRGDVQVWVNELGKEMAPASVHKVYRILAASLSEAVGDGKLALSPCAKINLPTQPPGKERYLTRAEVDLILYQLAEPYRTAAVLLVGTGMRWGEMAGLHWQRVDLVNNAVDVVETHNTAGGIKSYPKSKKMRRVPLPSWAAEAIVNLAPETQQAKECGLPHARGSRCSSGLVIPAPAGGALDPHNMRARHWQPAVQYAGIDDPPPTIHDLRHTTASWALQGGATLPEVQYLLGHASITTTMRYAHLARDHGERVRGILEGAL